MTQEIQDYKLNWLRKSSYRVKLPKDQNSQECLAWCTDTLEEKVWDYSLNPENEQYTFFFNSPSLAERFKSTFKNGDTRTVDLA